jgi:hypothetical protein
MRFQAGENLFLTVTPHVVLPDDKGGPAAHAAQLATQDGGFVLADENGNPIETDQ